MPESSLEAFAKFLAKWYVKGRGAAAVLYKAVQPALMKAFTAILGTRKRQLLSASLVLTLIVGIAGTVAAFNYSEEQARLAAVAVKADRDAATAKIASSKKLQEAQSNAADRLVTSESFLVESADYAAPEDSKTLKSAISKLRSILKSGTASELTSASLNVSTSIAAIGVRPTPHDWRITCTDEAYADHYYATFRDAWSSPLVLTGCTPGALIGDFFTDVQNAAVTSGASSTIEKVGTLYAICAELNFGPYASVTKFSDSQVKELTGALTICPDHPSAPLLQSKFADQAKAAADEASGVVFGSGVRKVGENIQPGIYVSDGSAGCYWERLDSTGEIIDNNFIMGATRAEVTVQSSDYSFNSTGCSKWKKQ